MFKIKEDEDIETMFSRFQVLISRFRDLNKSYTTFDHVKNILRSLPAKYRPKVAAIQEAKGLNKISLESLISNLRSHEMEIIGDEPTNISKSFALKYVGQPTKYPKV